VADAPSDSSSSSSGPIHEVFNASGEVAKNLIELFRNCTRAMQANDLKFWWTSLDSAFMEVDFSIKEKDRLELELLWKRIDPNKKDSYGLLKEYHLKLRRLCVKFFTMGETRTGPAIWRR